MQKRRKLLMQSTGSMNWDDTEQIQKMCKDIIRAHNPTGMLRESDDHIDTHPMTDFQAEFVAHKVVRSQTVKEPMRPTYLELIKGKPYCLRLGQKTNNKDNFLGFFETFYSYRHKEKFNQPLLKPSEVGYNPVRDAEIYQRLKNSKARSKTSRSTKIRPTPEYEFEQKKPSTGRTATSASISRRTIYRAQTPSPSKNEILSSQCNSIIFDCHRLLEAKIMRPKRQETQASILSFV